MTDTLTDVLDLLLGEHLAADLRRAAAAQARSP